MSKWTTEVKVGAFVMAALVILGYMTFAVGKFTLGKEKGYRVDAVLTSAAGLDLKAPVKVAGVEVGRVDGIGLSEDRARVRIRVLPGFRLRTGAQAAIRSSGLLGDKYVELVPGKGEGYLKDGDIIGEAEAPADIDQLIVQFTAVARDIREVSGSLREILASEQNQDSIRAILANLRTMSEGLNRLVQSNESLLSETLANLRDLSGNLNETVASNRESLTETVANLESFSRTLKEDGPRLMASLNNIADKIQSGEGTLGKMVTDKSLYDKLDTTLEGVNKMVTSVERFTTNVGFRGEYQVDDDSTKGYFSLKLQPRNDKYYNFEVVDDPKGRVRVTETETTTDGVTTSTREVKRSDQLKFSAEFARRFGDVVFRGGLKESSFGVGADLLKREDKFKLSLEAWNFDGEVGSPNPHLKAASSYTFFKSLFLQGGVDDFANPKTANTFAGAGLTFDDEDLKYIFSRFPVPIR